MTLVAIHETTEGDETGFRLMEPRMDDNQKLALSNVAKNVLRKHKMREYELSTKLQDLRHHKQKFPSLIELDSYQLLDSKSLSPFCKEQLTQREKEQLHGINPE